MDLPTYLSYKKGGRQRAGVSGYLHPAIFPNLTFKISKFTPHPLYILYYWIYPHLPYFIPRVPFCACLH